MPVKPPPDKSDKLAPLPPVNDGLKKPAVQHFDPPMPEDSPVRKET
jgi:hypothetical protein